MKRSKYISTLSALTLALMGMTLTESAMAQGGGPPTYQKDAIEAMKKGQWQAALVPIDKCLETYGPRAKSLGFGDEFGWFYFQKGVCLMKMKEYDKAIQAFTDCYTKFPGDKNEFLRVSLCRMGECQFLAKKYDEAIVTLEKFLKERRNTGMDARVNAGQIFSIMAQCYFLGSKPSFEKGIDAVSKCVVNRYRGQGISDDYLVNAFLTMVRAGIDQENPQPVVDFLNEYPSIINMGAARVAPYGPELLKLASSAAVRMGDAQDAGKADLALAYARLALDLYGFVPNMGDVKADVAAISKRIEPFKERGGIADTATIYSQKTLDAVTKTYDKLADQKVVLDGYALMGLASSYLNYGSVRAANAIYKILEEQYPMLKERETNLYQLAMTTWTLGDVKRASELVEQHIKEFPNSKYAKVLNTMSLEKLLKEGKYDECIQQAVKVKELNADDPTGKFYILASYCEPVAYFQLKKYKEAVPLFEEFIKKYPDNGSYTQQSLFYLASSLTSLGRWKEAIEADSAYIEKYPDFKDNPFIGNMLYDRAFNNLQLQTKENDALALKDCKTIIDNLPESKVYPLALLLMGNIYSSEPSKMDEANEFYVKSYEAAKKIGNKRCMSEAVYNLVANYAGDGSHHNEELAKKYYDIFWADCDAEKNPFALQTAVAGMGLYKDGKKPEAFEAARKKLADIIVREGQLDSKNLKVEQAVGSYTKFYLDAHKAMGKELTLDQVKEHFYNFPGVSKDDISLKTILRTAVIGVYQDELAQLKPEESEKKAILEGIISAFFKELKNDYKPSDLTPYILLKLGTYIGQTDQPLEALAYYDEILKRNKGYKKEANFGKAIAMGRSSDKGKIDEAVKLMNDELVAERAKPQPDRKSMEEAQMYMVRFQLGKEDYPKAAEEAERYLADKSYNKFKPEVMFNLGIANVKQGKMDQAIAAFLNLVNNYKGMIKWSAPAQEELMKAFWQRNNPRVGYEKQSDRYIAWQNGTNYISVTKPNFMKMSVDERNKWRKVEDLVKKYGADPSVMEEHRDYEARKAAIKASQGK